MFGVQQAWRAESCRQKQTNPTFAVEAWKVLSKTSDSVQNMMHLVYTDSTWFTVTCDDVTAPLSQRSMLAIHRFFQKRVFSSLSKSARFNTNHFTFHVILGI